MIEIDATILVQMINFAIFIFIMNKILFGPLVRTINDRRDYITLKENEIAKGLSKLEESEKEHKAHLDEARKKAQEMIGKNLLIAEEEKKSIIQAAIDETRNVFKDYKKELDEETVKVREQLQSEIDSMAEEIAVKVIALDIPENKVPV